MADNADLEKIKKITKLIKTLNKNELMLFFKKLKVKNYYCINCNYHFKTIRLIDLLIPDGSPQITACPHTYEV
jgi:hypothetical protein